MIIATKPDNEQERISALYEYNLLDTMPEEEYDDITRIAAAICNMPIALISLIDNDRQWFKSKVGLDVSETHRDFAFCAHAILTPKEIFEVKSTKNDVRFSDNPLAVEGPHIGFYAGVPLVNETGIAMGTLCVIDQKPNELESRQKETLKALARQVVANFEIRKKNRQLTMQRKELDELNADLSKFAYVAAHDLKSPCSSLAMSATILREKYAHTMDSEGLTFLKLMEETSYAAINMVDGILKHTQTVNTSDITKDSFTFNNFSKELKQLLNPPPEFTLNIVNGDLELYTSQYMLMQVLINLCNNAIKYNDKKVGIIKVSADDIGAFYRFAVTDNGPGIAEKNQTSIFEMFSTLGVTDRFNNKGTGIGLSTVKRLVQKMSGTISVTSELGTGSTFEFTFSK